ncbi:Alpha/Beta hydrolase protein [Spinellus fusiger]|nr:Alpha/Beta hydrolase protein [Spinellus fusiger]
MAVVKTVFLGTFILVFFYIALILLLCFPIPQRMIVYCNWLQFPLYPRFSMPEYYGFGHHQVRNMQITTEDNITLVLGAWHILPYDYYRQGIRYQDKFDGYDDVLADPQYPTFVYFHGNAMSRTAMWRVEFYKSLTSRFGKANIIVIDYRGFGDSEGVPSEEGLKKDARATLNWLLERKVPHHHISLIGHSLGTGVATTLAYEMTKAGDPLHALILEAAYSSLPNLLFEYRFLETIPILGPLHHFSWIKELLLERLFHTFDSLSLIHVSSCIISSS